MSARGFRRTGQRVVHEGERITLAVATFEAPDGTTFERDIVLHPGAVAIVPVIDEGTAVLLVRQYRGAVDRLLLEIPAGIRDIEGEAPEQTARRELEEEVGMRAGRVERLCEFFNSAGHCSELTHVFMALDLEPVATSFQGVEEQHMSIERIALDDVPAMVASGAIADAKTVIGLALAREALA